MTTATAVDALKDLRAAAKRRFAELGWPATHLESWKYTNLAAAARTAWHHSEAVSADTGREHSLAAHAVVELIFVNGVLTSSHGAGSEGLVVTNLAAPGIAEEFAGVIGRVADPEQNAMTALNIAEMLDGACIRTAEGTVVEGFIHLLFISEGDEVWSHPHNVIVAGRNSQLTVVENYMGSGRYLTNTVTEIVAEDGAVVDHYKIITESHEATHTGTLHVRQRRSSSVVSRNVTVGGALVRNDTSSELTGEGASIVMDGLFVTAGTQHVDNHTRIDHASPHCESLELYKGILDDSSRGVFDGTIIVREGAQKTSSRQTNKNLLLSASAIVDSKPTLEISNDDVKCNHGSTIGQLDEQALFYLRARGISEDDATHMLVYAFASEIVDRMHVQPVQEQIRRALFKQLPARLPERRERER